MTDRNADIAATTPATLWAAVVAIQTGRAPALPTVWETDCCCAAVVMAGPIPECKACGCPMPRTHKA